MGSTKRASVLDARSAPRRGEDRRKAIRINPTLSVSSEAERVTELKRNISSHRRKRSVLCVVHELAIDDE